MDEQAGGHLSHRWSSLAFHAAPEKVPTFKLSVTLSNLTIFKLFALLESV